MVLKVIQCCVNVILINKKIIINVIFIFFHLSLEQIVFIFIGVIDISNIFDGYFFAERSYKNFNVTQSDSYLYREGGIVPYVLSQRRGTRVPGLSTNTSA